MNGYFEKVDKNNNIVGAIKSESLKEFFSSTEKEEKIRSLQQFKN